MYRTNFQTKSYFVAFGFWSIDSKCFHIKWHSNLSITSSLLLVLFLSYRLLASYACTRTNVKCLNRNDCSFCGQQNDRHWCMHGTALWRNKSETIDCKKIILERGMPELLPLCWLKIRQCRVESHTWIKTRTFNTGTCPFDRLFENNLLKQLKSFRHLARINLSVYIPKLVAYTLCDWNTCTQLIYGY